MIKEQYIDEQVAQYNADRHFTNKDKSDMWGELDYIASSNPTMPLNEAMHDAFLIVEHEKELAINSLKKHASKQYVLDVEKKFEQHISENFKLVPCWFVDEDGKVIADVDSMKGLHYSQGVCDHAEGLVSDWNNKNLNLDKEVINV